MTAAAAVGIASAACSTDYAAAPDPGIDAGTEDALSNSDGSSSDANDARGDTTPDASAMCNPRAPFDAPALLAGVDTTYGEFGARLTNDELTVYFSSARPSGTDFDIFVAKRTSITNAFGSPTRIAALSSVIGDGYPSISVDGLEIFLARASTTFASYEMFVARRATADAGFGTPTLLAGTNDPANADTEPFVAQNGDLYFASARRPASGTDIFLGARLPDGGFGPPTAIEELTTAAVDGNPVLSFDMLTMYFQSQRTDQGGDSTGDIWVAHRASLSAPFGDIKRVAELSMLGSVDLPTWLSADNCRLYMSRQNAGLLRIYLATRRP